LPFTLPTIYPITNVELSGLSHAEQVRQFATAGCRFLQIREKLLSGKEFFEVVCSAIEIAESFGMKVIVNDRVDIAMAARASGVHLGQNDLPPEHARKLLGDEAIIGFSTHSVDQAIEAVKFPIDYIAIGPISPTSSKENPDPVVGVEELRRVRDKIGVFPLVAIGGINGSNLEDALATGADSVALINALYNDQSNITEQFTILSNLADAVKQR
jgi:thiamine-phosphate pyrophosphorylase